MTLNSSPNSRSNSRISGAQGSATLMDNSSSDVLQYIINLQQLQERNLQLTKMLLDAVRRNVVVEENTQAQTEQKKLINAVPSSRELDAQAKEHVPRDLKTLKDQRGTQSMN